MNFLQWLKENGSINQSMPELDKEELPSGKTTTTEPYSVINNNFPKKFSIKAREGFQKIKDKLMRHPGEWVVDKSYKSDNYLKARNTNDNYELILPINKIEIF